VTSDRTDLSMPANPPSGETGAACVLPVQARLASDTSRIPPPFWELCWRPERRPEIPAWASENQPHERRFWGSSGRQTWRAF
jgi:hypothetical protein